MSNEFHPLGIGIDTAINLLSQVFGAHYILPQGTESNAIDGVYQLTTEADASYDRLIQFGTPVMGTFWIVPNSLPYMIYADGKLVEREFEKFEFPIATIVDFSRKKAIVISDTIGGKGSVKEIMGLGDWDINIRGILMDDTSRELQKKMSQQQYFIDRMNEIAGTLKVEGKIFDSRGIHHIVITDLKYSAIQGKPGMMQYEINALSDEEFFL